MIKQLFVLILFICLFSYYIQAIERDCKKYNCGKTFVDLQNNIIESDFFEENGIQEKRKNERVNQIATIKNNNTFDEDILGIPLYILQEIKKTTGNRASFQHLYASNNQIPAKTNEMDIWQLDEKGYLLNTITKDNEGKDINFDRIEVLDNDGNTKEQTANFEPGTISQQEVFYRDEKETYNIFTIQGSENAKNIFETLANPEKATKVEWAHTTFSIDNDSIKNFVSTSHKENTETSGGYLFNINMNQGYRLLNHNHNHIVDSPYPSGMYRNKLDKSSDIIAVTQWTKRILRKFGAGTEPKFCIYDYIRKTYVVYDRYSKPADFEIQTPEQ